VMIYWVVSIYCRKKCILTYLLTY